MTPTVKIPFGVMRGRGDAFVEAAKLNAIRADEHGVELAADEYAKLKATMPHTPPAAAGKRERREPVPPQPVPRDEWPRIVRYVAKFRRAGDTGIGDTIKRLADTFGAGSIARKLKAAGIDCGCDGRRAWMNARYPYAEAKQEHRP